MVNKIWLFLFIIGFAFAFMNGNVKEVHEAIFSAPKDGIMLLIHLSGLYILWNGILEIVKDLQLIDKLSKKIYPITRFLFPELPKIHAIHGYIASNLISNMLGLGSVATPLGIKAMKEMQELNPNKKVATRSMVTLVIINASSVTLLPTTLISLREINGSLNSVGVLPILLITSIVTTTIAIILDRLYVWLRDRREER